MKKERKWDGVALAGSFILIVMFLSVNSDYLGHQLISRIVAIIFCILGIGGMTSELSKIIDKKIDGIIDFGVGILILVLWGFIYYHWNYPVVNFFILVLLLVGFYGVLIGMAKIIESIKTATITWTIKQVGIVIANCSVFILTILQILQIIRSKS